MHGARRKMHSRSKARLMEPCGIHCLRWASPMPSQPSTVPSILSGWHEIRGKGGFGNASGAFTALGHIQRVPTGNHKAQSMIFQKQGTQARGSVGAQGGWTQLDLAALGGYRRSHSKPVFTAKPLPVQKVPSSRRHSATVKLVIRVQGTR